MCIKSHILTTSRKRHRRTDTQIVILSYPYSGSAGEFGVAGSSIKRSVAVDGSFGVCSPETTGWGEAMLVSSRD